jgi:hypothetical protein
MPRQCLEDNIKMDVKDIWFEDVNLAHPAQPAHTRTNGGCGWQRSRVKTAIISRPAEIIL